ALNIVNEKEYKHAKKVLSAAAMTYVASTAVALAELARIILIARSSD
ncbi:zinc metallopeptidase, partial [Staphylococcus epidermidis]